MRNEDSTLTGIQSDDSQSSGPQSIGLSARDDFDVIPAGLSGPATGNAVTGVGTVSGAAGADGLGTGQALITAIQGAGGTDSSFSGGNLSVEGKYGTLRIDAQGNYQYTRNADSPRGVTDVFNYTLADKAGATDVARLAIRIEDDPEKLAQAEQIIVGPDGVVVLPAGVSLADIVVSGRNLIINMPDGTQKVIVDGAVFVPQLVLDGVEVPSTNLASLLIDSEPQPAAGPPQSSGGNFEVPVSPLDPGVPLGDLLPPTELGYVPPEFEEIQNPVNQPDAIPVILIQPDGSPATLSAIDSVDEAALPARVIGGQPEPAGSNAGSTGETTGGVILVTSPDGVQQIVLSVGGTNYVVVGQGAVTTIPGVYGTLTITSVDLVAGTIGYSYTLIDNTSGDSTEENIVVVLTDTDGDVASATLTITIADDVPTARADTDSVTEDGPTVAVGNVISGAGSDGNAAGGDTVGADGAYVSFVDGTNPGVGQTIPDADGNVINGQYGTLLIASDGSYTYTLYTSGAAFDTVQALSAGQSLTESFNYTLTDNDTDASSSTLVITINGSNDVPTVTVPQAGEAGTAVDEAGLPARTGNLGAEPAGSDAAANSETTVGAITFTNGDGASTVTITVNAVTYVVVGAGAVTSIPGDYGTLTITSVVGNTINYSYTLTDNVDNDSDATPFESFLVTVADSDGNPADDASATLTITIADDVPTARADTDSVTEDGPTVAVGNVISGAGSDGNAAGGDTVGADGAYVSFVDGTNPGVGQTIPDADGNVINGQYGTLLIASDGSYTYTLYTSGAAFDTVQALSAGQSLTESFNYTLTDNDTDASSSTLVITINGSNDVPTVTVPQAGEAGTAVDEAGLPARTGNLGAEPAGSDAAANSETTVGAITFTNGDGASTVTITVNAVTYVVVGAGAVTSIPGDYGTLTITSVVGNTINYSYTLTDNVDNDSDATPFESFLVTVADSDGNPADDASATLTITIADDVPTARADTDSVTEDGPTVAVGNVISGAGSDGNAAGGDTVGADGAYVSFVDGTNPGVGQTIPDADGNVINGQYGTLLIASDGSYTYTLYTSGAAFDTVQALSAGQSLTESFNYTLTDNDTDASSSTLVITINGSNDVPTVTVPQAGEAGTAVDEAGLPARTGNLGAEPAGSDAAANSETTVGAITFTNGDGASTVTITVNAVTYVVVGAGAVTSIPGDYGTLTITSVVGNTINYSYTLTDNVDNDSDATPFESFLVTVADSDGNPADDASATLTITIADDVPTARADTDSVTEDGPTVAVGNVISGAGSDGNAAGGDTVGADGAYVSFVDGTNPGVGQTIPDADGNVINGQYGTLLIASDGSYTYTLYTSGAAFDTVQALSAGQSLTESFNYTLTDNDTDASSSTLVITINGSNDVPTVTVPQAGEAGTAVDEAGLPARTGNLGAEPAGSDAAANSETTVGAITFTNGDGASTVTITVNAVTYVVVGAGAVTSIPGDYGTLTITSVVGNTINYSYTLTDNVDNDSDATPFESFLVTVADSDGNPADDASATLTITIADDVPTARADTDSVTEDGPTVAVGNVISGAGSDGNAAGGDTVGADGAYVSFVDGTNPGVGQTIPDADGNVINGQYGTLLIASDGSYTYTLYTSGAAFDTVQALSAGQSLTESFNYTLTDNDTDASSSTLVITINGSNDVPTVTVPQAGEAGTAVDEAGLPARTGNLGAEPAGSDAAANSETTVGAITFTNGDGASTVTITVNAVTYVVVGAGAVTSIPGDYGTLTITSVVGNTINYSYTLTDNVDNDSDATPFESFLVTVADSDGNPADDASATLTITIADDVPTARADTDSVTEDGPTVAVGNVISGAGSDGNAAGGDTVGADGAYVSFVDGTNPGVGQTIPDADGNVINGQYGTLLIASDGSYTYTLYTSGAAFDTVQALSAGQSLTESFNYTLTDNDTDASSSTLVITINGSNDVPTVTVPQAGEAGTAVDEAGLPARTGNLGAEPAGSDAAANSETTVGAITFTNGDGASTVTITVNAVTYVVVGAGAVTSIPGDYGTLTITSVVGNTINYSYTLTDNVDNDSDATPFESFLVTVADSDGNPADDASATLTITIADDVPTARADTDSVTEDGPTVAVGNVISGAGSDGNAAGGDTVGADGAYVSFVDGTNPGVGQTIPDADGNVINGQYGTLLIASDGSYTYTLYTSGAAFDTVQALSAGQSLTESFNYTLTDNDTDASSSTLVITINGSNDVPTVTVPQAGEAGTAVDEAGLPARTGNLGAEPAGSDAAANSETTVGAITFTNGDGASTVTITVNAVTYVVVGAGAVTSIPGDYGTLTITSVVGNTINYSYTLTDNVDNDSDATPFESFLVTVADSDGNPADDASATLTITIADDVPTANNDAPRSVAEDGANINGNVLTNDVQGADGAVVTHINLGGGFVAITTGILQGDGSYQFTDAGVGVYTIKADGSWTFDPAVGQSNNVTPVDASFSYRITDNDQDISEAVQPIEVTDGAGPGAGGSVALTLDEASLDLFATGDLAAGSSTGTNPSGTTETQIVTGAPGLHFTSGSDAITSVAFSTNFAGINVTGLQTGYSISWAINASNQLVGTLMGPGAVNLGTAVLVALTGETSGAAAGDTADVGVTATLVGPLEHVYPNGTQGPVSISGIGVIASQADGDSNSGTISISVTDDAPTLSAVTDQTVPNQIASYTGQITFDYGADGGGKIVLTPLTAITGLSYSTDPVTGTVTASVNGNPYFTVSVDQETGEYTLDVLTVRPVVSTPLDFTTIAPGNYDTVVVGGATFNGLTFTGTGATTFQNPGNNTDTINPSGNGFGTGNNLQNDDDGFLFSYANSGALNFDFNFQPNTTTVLVSWATYSTDPLTGGTVLQSGSFTVSKVGDADGIVPVSIDPTMNFNHIVVRFDVSSGTGGRVENFRVVTDVVPDNQVIKFGVTIIDGDNDSVTGATPSTTIDLTFQGGAPVPPVVLDTNHDGVVGFLGLEAAVLYDIDNDGTLDATAWFAPGDSLLFHDADGNGTVSHAGEFVFGSAGVTDLEALHAMYGDQLDASDEAFTQFALWDDANSNGVVDTGEVKSLAEAGICSISLVSDGLASNAAGGDVQIAGHASFTYVNDNGEAGEGVLADAAFNYVSGEAEQRNVAQLLSSGATAAAVAAFGLSVAVAASVQDAAGDASSVTGGLASAGFLDGVTGLAAAVEVTGSNHSLIGSESVEPANDDGGAVSTAATASAGGSSAGLDSGNAPTGDSFSDLPDGTVLPDHASATIDLSSMSVVADPGAAFDVAAEASQHNQVVGKIVLEAIEEGAIDAAIANLGGNGRAAEAALKAVASPAGEAVSGWDNGHIGQFTSNAIHAMTMEAMLHHDAIQPSSNG